MESWRESIQPCIEKWKKSRLTRYIKKMGINAKDVHVHNNLPLNVLVKEFKHSNGVKNRSFDKLTEENKKTWLEYYDTHKNLIMMTREEHEEFHERNGFNEATKEWNECATSKIDKPKSGRMKSDKPKSDKPKSDKLKCDKPKSDKLENDQLNDKSKSDKPKSDRLNDKLKSDKLKCDKPKSDKSKNDKPKNDKPKNDKPKNDRPSHKPKSHKHNKNTT